MCACTGRQFNFHFCDITAPLGTRTIIEFSFITWLYYIYRSSRWKYGRDVTRTRKPYYRWLKKVSLSTLSAFTLTTVVRNPPSESTLIIERSMLPMFEYPSGANQRAYFKLFDNHKSDCSVSSLMGKPNLCVCKLVVLSAVK